MTRHLRKYANSNFEFNFAISLPIYNLPRIIYDHYKKMLMQEVQNQALHMSFESYELIIILFHFCGGVETRDLPSLLP